MLSVKMRHLFLRLSEKDGDANSTDASFWRIIFWRPGGAGRAVVRPDVKRNALRTKGI